MEGFPVIGRFASAQQHPEIKMPQAFFVHSSPTSKPVLECSTSVSKLLSLCMSTSSLPRSAAVASFHTPAPQLPCDPLCLENPPHLNPVSISLFTLGLKPPSSFCWAS